METREINFDNEPMLDGMTHLVTDRALSGETMLLNMGPQHPSTHGVLRLLVELDGEIVVTCIPDIGFLHTGVEKNMESKPYQQAEVMTDRLDYTFTIGNNLTYCLAVEKLVDLDVPVRAQAIRVILTELSRLASHLLWIGTSALDLAAMSVFLYAMREREMILDVCEMCAGQRMMTTYIRPGGLWRDVPVEFEAAVRKIIETQDEIKRQAHAHGRADELHEVAHAHGVARQCRNIHAEQIHRHAPDDGHAPAVDRRRGAIAEASRIAVGVSRADHGEPDNHVQGEDPGHTRIAGQRLAVQKCFHPCMIQAEIEQRQEEEVERGRFFREKRESKKEGGEGEPAAAPAGLVAGRLL